MAAASREATEPDCNAVLWTPVRRVFLKALVTVQYLCTILFHQLPAPSLLLRLSPHLTFHCVELHLKSMAALTYTPCQQVFSGHSAISRLSGSQVAQRSMNPPRHQLTIVADICARCPQGQQPSERRISLQYLNQTLCSQGIATAHSTAGISEAIAEGSPSEVSVGRRGRVPHFCDQKARLLRQRLRELEPYHDTMYHSALASRLA